MDRLPGLILCFTGLAIFGAVAWYILGKIRHGGKTEASITANEQLSLFGSMYEQGELTKEEYRAIKSALAETISLEAERLSAAKDDEAASRGEVRGAFERAFEIVLYGMSTVDWRK